MPLAWRPPARRRAVRAAHRHVHRVRARSTPRSSIWTIWSSSASTPSRSCRWQRSPAAYGWGYDGVGLYAVHEPYGGPLGVLPVRRRLPCPRSRRLPRRRLQPSRPERQPARRSSVRTSPTATARRGVTRSTSTTPTATRYGGSSSTTRAMWLRDFHVDGLRLDAVHALFDDRAVTLLEELSAEVNALVDPARPAALADRRVGPERPAHRHTARGRWPRPARAVGGRRPPRSARRSSPARPRATTRTSPRPAP